MGIFICSELLKTSLILHSNLNGLTGSPNIGSQLLPAASCRAAHPAAHQVACDRQISQVWGGSWNSCQKTGLKSDFFCVDTCHPQHSGHTACPAPLQDNRNVRWSNMGRLKIRSHRGSNTGYITSFKVTTFEERPMLPGCPVNFFIRSRFIGPWKRYLCSTTLVKSL